MKQQESADRAVLRSPYAFHMIGVILVIISVLTAAFLPGDNFLVVPGILGDRWSLMGIIVVISAILAINFIASVILFKRDKVLFWVASAASVVISAGAFMKVASVAYFW